MELNDQNMKDVADFIYNMRDDTTTAIEAQSFIRVIL